MPKPLTDAQRTFVRHLEFLSTGRIEEWVQLFTFDGVLTFPYAPAGFPTRVTGHADIRAHMDGFDSNYEIAFDNVVFYDTVDESIVIAELQGHGKSLATGEAYEQSYVSIVHTADSLITSYADYWNPLALV